MQPGCRVTISVLATLYLEPFARFLGATDQLMPYVSQHMTPINCTCFAFILSSMMQVTSGGLQPQIGDDCHRHWQSV